MTLRTEYFPGLGAAGSPSYAESEDFAATGSGPWVFLAGLGVHNFTVNVIDKGGAQGVWVAEGRQRYSDGSYSPTVVLKTYSLVTETPEIGRITGNWEVRLRCTTYTAGTYALGISWDGE